MLSPMFGEFMGTMVLVLLGNGVIADVALARSKAEGGGWIVISAGWGFAAMAGIFKALACGSKDGHINPPLTLGVARARGKFSQLAPYVPGQMVGEFPRAVLVWLLFLPQGACTL